MSDGYDDELFFIVRYMSGTLGIHPMCHMSIHWVVEKSIVAQDLTWSEATALIKITGSTYETGEPAIQYRPDA